MSDEKCSIRKAGLKRLKDSTIRVVCDNSKCDWDDRILTSDVVSDKCLKCPKCKEGTYNVESIKVIGVYIDLVGLIDLGILGDDKEKLGEHLNELFDKLDTANLEN